MTLSWRPPLNTGCNRSHARSHVLRSGGPKYVLREKDFRFLLCLKQIFMGLKNERHCPWMPLGGHGPEWNTSTPSKCDHCTLGVEPNVHHAAVYHKLRVSQPQKTDDKSIPPIDELTSVLRETKPQPVIHDTWDEYVLLSQLEETQLCMPRAYRPISNAARTRFLWTPDWLLPWGCWKRIVQKPIKKMINETK